MRAFEAWITGIADAWWVHLVVLGLSFLDGFFPTVPSESVIVSLASLASSSGKPSLVLLVLAAWIGAALGDNVGYLIGRLVGWERFRLLREGRGRRAVEAAERGLERRALLFLMTARYIPFGRTAVNLVAGAVHYPHGKFLRRDLASTFVWALYSVGIGVLAGQWFEHNRLLGIAVSLVAAVVISLGVERIVTLVHDALDRRAAAREGGADGGTDEPATSREGDDLEVPSPRGAGDEPAGDELMDDEPMDDAGRTVLVPDTPDPEHRP